MKIRGWQVEGFGVFGGYQVGDLPDGLVVVHGPNEAGKSTLLAFLRGVLFGFPDRRGHEPLYPALRGGRMGGALLLEGPEGLFRVERIGGRRPVSVLRPGGQEGNENDLRQLLGGADRQLFRSVFAFSLNELANMDTLGSEEIRARIFSAGIAGAGRSAKEVIEALRKEAASLLGPRSGKIRELVEEAQSLSGRIAAAVSAASEYTDALRQEELAKRDVGRLFADVQRADSHSRRMRTLIDLWPTESDRQGLLQGLSRLPDVRSFPVDADSRLAVALSEVRSAVDAFSDAQQKLRQRTEQRQAIEVDERLPGIAAAVADLAARCAAHREHLERVRTEGTNVDQYNERLEEVVRDLGPGWDEARLHAFDTSLPATEVVRDWQRRLEHSRRDSEKAAAELSSFETIAARIEEALQRIGSESAEPGDAITEDTFRRLATRLFGVAEDIGILDCCAPDLVFQRESLEPSAARVAGARQECARLRIIASDARDRLVGCEVNEALADLRDDAMDVARQVEVERQRLRDIASQEAMAMERRDAVDRGIRDLGLGWDEDRVVGVTCEFAQIQQARDFAARFAADRERLLDVRRELDHVRKGVSAREKDLSRRRLELEGQEPTASDVLERQGRLLRRVRIALSELAGLDGAIRAEERAKADASREASPPPDRSSLLWVPALAVVVAIVLVLLAAWRLVERDITAGVTLAAAGIMSAVLVFGLRAATRFRTGHDESSVEQRRRRADEIDARTSDLQARFETTKRAIAEDAAVLGLAALPTPEQVEDRQEQWSREREARRRRDEIAADVERLSKELESWCDSEVRREEEDGAARGQSAETLEEWEAWLGSRRLPTGVPPDTTRDLLQQLRPLQERIEDRNAIDERLRIARGAWEEWRSHAVPLLLAAGDGTADRLDAAGLFDHVVDVQRRSTEEAARLRQRGALELEVENWLSKVADADHTLSAERAMALSEARTAYESMLHIWQAGETVREQRRAHLKIASAGATRITGEWEAWQASHGLERPVSPDGVIDFFGLVRRGQETITQRGQAERQLEGVGQAAADWQVRAEQLVIAAGDSTPGGSPDAWIDTINALNRRCQADATARTSVAGLDEEIDEAKATLAALHERELRARDGLTALFGEADASSETEFRERLTNYRERQRLQQKIAELEARITAVIGAGEATLEWRQALALGRIAEWTAELDRSSRETSDLRTRHEESIRRHQDLSNRLRQLEEAADVAEMELQQQGVLDELAGAVRRRRVLSLAESLVSATLREFERTRQPAVLANASVTFERVTSGRYSKVLQTEAGDGVAVLDRLGARRTIGELSRGTQEQLYLSMRLGLAREFGERAVPLPLVMDDVLVNFDESRARHMAVELMTFAEDHQVLLFTCHSFVRSMLLDLDPDVRVIDLPLQEVMSGLNVGGSDAGVAFVDRGSMPEAADIESGVLRVLAATPCPVTLSDLSAALECEPDHARRALASLRATGQVVMTGQKKGARYELVQPERT